MSPSSVPSVDGRDFAGQAVEGGEVGADTVFHYREADGEIWASYSGGQVRRGYLVGRREGDTLDFRYVQLNVNHETSSGHCATQLELLDDGRIRMHETWEWESRPGTGTSVVEKVSRPRG